MSDKPTVNMNFGAPLNRPNITGNVEGDLNINENNNNQTVDQTLVVTEQILEELKRKYPQVTSEKEATKIIEAEFEEHKSVQSWKWKNLLDLKHLWNGGKTAAIKIGEHFVEENPWGKGLIGFLEGVSEDAQ